jgi:hypothetical protein
MGFEVVHCDTSNQKLWAPLINTDTLYANGQLLVSANEGVSPLVAASGAADTSQKQIPWGVTVGTNKKTPTFSATYNSDSITYAAADVAGSEDYVGVEGPWAKNDREAMVEYLPLTATTVLRAPLYTDTLGTSPTVATFASGLSTLGGTSSAVEEAGVATLSTLFIRSGVVAGSYRVTDDTSATVMTWDNELNAAPEVGDTAVRVNLRPLGTCRMQIGTEALFIDTGATVTTNYFLIDVVRLDLREAGKEYVEFRFHPSHFDSVRT